MKMTKKLLTLSLFALLAGCGQPSYVQKASPSNEFKDYKQDSASVIGVGEPISKRQMRANATLTVKGSNTLEAMMNRVASTYNLAIRWGSGVRTDSTREVMISELTFDEARAYLEDVYKIQIVREGERRLLVLPAADEPRIAEFAPGANVALSDVIRGLADQCSINVVITENKSVLANTYITTSLKNVTCADAFEAVLGPHGLSLQDEGQFFTIAGLPQRQWTLDLYEPVRSEEQRISYTTNIESASTNDTGSSGASAQVSNPSGGSALSLLREERNLWSDLEQDLNTLIQRSCSELRAARTEGRAAQLAPAIAGAPGLPAATAARPQSAAPADVDCGYVRVNRAVGMVQMRATRSVLAEADQIVKKVADIASRRLLVEARVLAVSRKRGFDQGADWGAGNGDGSFGFTPQNTRLKPGRSIAGDIAAVLAGEDVGVGGFLSARGTNLDGVVRLIESFGTTYNLLQPTLEVMDRQRATIIDGRNERYFIRDSEIVTGDNGAQPIINSSVEERNQFVGMQFSVTAQVAEGANDLHTLLLQLPITEITEFKPLVQQIGNDEDGAVVTQTDAIPIATTRVIDQKVRIRDGEIKVIGGLNRTLAVDKESGIPLIRGIPLAGKAFNEENITFEDVEFIILLQVRRLD